MYILQNELSYTINKGDKIMSWCGDEVGFRVLMNRACLNRFYQYAIDSGISTDNKFAIFIDDNKHVVTCSLSDNESLETIFKEYRFVAIIDENHKCVYDLAIDKSQPHCLFA